MCCKLNFKPIYTKFIETWAIFSKLNIQKSNSYKYVRRFNWSNLLSAKARHSVSCVIYFPFFIFFFYYSQKTGAEAVLWELCTPFASLLLNRLDRKVQYQVHFPIFIGQREPDVFIENSAHENGSLRRSRSLWSSEGGYSP